MTADPVRVADMCRLYKEGRTLQQIGTLYGLSRERVRQIVSKAGVSRYEGGVGRRAAVKSSLRAAVREARAEARVLATLGCGRAELVALNGTAACWRDGTRTRAYLSQRTNARKRGIEWLLTFPEWCRIWDESGMWHTRGRSADSGVMARLQDMGPYAAWNVYITTLAQNVVDYQAELKRRGVECTDGYKRLPERAESLGVAA